MTTIAHKSRLRSTTSTSPSPASSARFSAGPPAVKTLKPEATRPEAQRPGPPVSRRAGLRAVAVLVDKNIFTGHEGARAPVVSARDALRLTARCEERMCSPYKKSRYPHTPGPGGPRLPRSATATLKTHALSAPRQVYQTLSGAARARQWRGLEVLVG